MAPSALLHCCCTSQTPVELPVDLTGTPSLVQNQSAVSFWVNSARPKRRECSLAEPQISNNCVMVPYDAVTLKGE